MSGESALQQFGQNPRRWPVLRPLQANAPERLILVNRAACLVGARSLVHMHLDSPQVSRAHALIVNEGGRVYVRDLASTNGVWVNGAAVREAELHLKDMLRFGPFVLVCQANFPPRPADGALATSEEPGGDLADTELFVETLRLRVDLRPRTVLIGRRRSCDLLLRDNDISRVHAVAFRRDGRQYLRDLNSKNGTFVNGRQVREAELQAGDEVRIGRHVLRYQPRPVEPAGVEAEAPSHALLTLVGADSGTTPLPVQPETGSSVGLSSSVTLLSLGAAARGERQRSSVEDTHDELPGAAVAPAPAPPADADAAMAPLEASVDELLASMEQLPTAQGGGRPDDMPLAFGSLAPAADARDVFGEQSGSSLNLVPASEAGPVSNAGAGSAVPEAASPVDFADLSAAEGLRRPGGGPGGAARGSMELVGASPPEPDQWAVPDAGVAHATELFADATPVAPAGAQGPAAEQPADPDSLMLSEFDLAPPLADAALSLPAGDGDGRAVAAEGGDGTAPPPDSSPSGLGRPPGWRSWREASAGARKPPGVE